MYQRHRHGKTMKALAFALLLFPMLAFAQTTPTAVDKAQDIAVAKDQAKQSNVLTTERSEANYDQDVATYVDNARQNEAITQTAAKVDAVKDQSITDRQYMMLLSGLVIVMLFAIWLIVYRATSRLHGGHLALLERADLLDKHIAETTALILKAQKKNRG